MPLPKLVGFNIGCDVDNSVVPNNQEVPKELDVYCRLENEFLPPGKTFADLTPEELKDLQNKYRFDVYKPGIYQGITARVKGGNIV